MFDWVKRTEIQFHLKKVDLQETLWVRRKLSED